MWFSPQRRAIFQHLNFKSAPSLTCFVHFDLNMCFSPQRRAIFQHLNFKKRSEPDVFCTFWLENVLLATMACNFSTSQISTSKSAPNLPCFVHFDLRMCFLPQRRAIFDFSSDHMTLHLPLNRAYFSTHRTHESLEKTQHFATSLTFGAGEASFFWLSRYCIFFLLTLLHLLTLLSSDFTSSLCFSSAFQLSILSEVYQ